MGVGGKKSANGEWPAGGGTSRNEARAHHLGIKPPGTAFACILPGHDHEAQLRVDGHGYWLYTCAEGSDLSLARVRASQGFGRVVRLNKVLSARWAERLDHDAGLLSSREVDVSVSPKWSDATQQVAHGLALFLGLRDERWLGQPFTFARDFVCAYCDGSYRDLTPCHVTTDKARYAIETLEREGVVVRVPCPRASPLLDLRTKREPIRWQLGDRRPAQNRLQRATAPGKR